MILQPVPASPTPLASLCACALCFPSEAASFVILDDCPNQATRAPRVTEREAFAAQLRFRRSRRRGPGLGEAPVAGDARCPLCAEALTWAVRCPECVSPHHPECWDYNAGCTTFGCGRAPGTTRAA